MNADAWVAVEIDIARIVAEDAHDPFDADTLANVRDFVNFARGACPAPAVGKGYWSTICFSWDTVPPIQVEVFSDRFEIYRFRDRHTDIASVKHVPGTPIPPQLAADLPELNRG